MAASYNEDHARFTRLCRLLIEYGTPILVDVFSKQILAKFPGKSLSDVFNDGTVKTKLSGVPSFNKQQKDLIYPHNSRRNIGIANALVTVTDFDITLLCLLLRNICSLEADNDPVWKNPPVGTSIEEDIVRIRDMRNTLYGHITSTSVNSAHFQQYWSDLTAVYFRLSPTLFPQQEFDDLKTNPVDLALFEKHKNLLEQWHLEESEILRELKEMQEGMKRHGASLKEIENALSKKVKMEMQDASEKNKEQLDEPICRFCYKSDCGEQVREELNDYYNSKLCKLQPLNWCPDFILPLKEAYTTLTLHRRQGSRYTRKTEASHQRKPHGLFSDSALREQQQVINLCTVFDDTDNFRFPKRILIEDDPGTGKSTLCKKLLLEWTSQTENQRWKINDFELLIFIEARQIQSNIKSEMCSQLFPKDFKFNEDDIWGYLTEHQENVLFIIDGYDELQAPNDDLTQLLDGKLMRKACVLVTSRPGQSLEFHAYFNKHITNKGFTKEQAFEFIDRYTRNMGQNEDIQKKAKQLYYTNHVVSELFCTPLMLLFILLLVEEKQSIEFTTLTQLYDDKIKAVCRRYLKSKYKQNYCDESLHTFVDNLSRDLGRVALEGLVSSKVVFDVTTDICNKSLKCPDDILNVGLLVLDHNVSRMNPRQTAFFMHKTVQEFFAAFELSNMDNDERSRYYAHINPNSQKQRSGTVGKNYFDTKVSNFLCGMLCNKDDRSALSHFLCYVCKLHSEMCRDIMLKHQNAGEDVMKTIKANEFELVRVQNFLLDNIRHGGNYIDDNMLQCLGDIIVLCDIGLPTLTNHIDSLCNFIKLYSRTKRDGLRYFCIYGYQSWLKQLTDTMRECKYNRLLGLYLEQSRESYIGVDLVSLSPNIETLHLNNMMVEHSVMILRTLKVSVSIKHLYISNIFSKTELNERIVALVDFLKTNETLTVLELSRVLCGNDTGSLIMVLKDQSHVAIKKIKLKHTGINSGSEIVSLVKTNNRVTDLDICENSIGDDEMASIITAMKEVKSNININIRHTNSGHKTGMTLIDLIRANKTLNVIDFSENPIGDYAMALIIETLGKEGVAMKRINIRNTNSGHKTIHALILLLSEINNIRFLDVSENDIGDDDMAELINTIKEQNVALETLKIWNTNSGPKTAMSLIDLLNTNKTFYDSVWQKLISAAGDDVFIKGGIHESVTDLILVFKDLGDPDIVALSKSLKKKVP